MSTSFAYLTRMSSPIGRLELTSDGQAITSLSIERDGHLPLEEHQERSNDVLERAVKQLGEYFAGDRKNFELPVSFGGSAFQRSVWERLGSLEYGQLTSYGELGLELGRPTAGRAIGGAVGANPIPIIIGCHRVLSSTGKITGYSGGEGIPTKLWLLTHEGIMLAA
ncbi:methylated-DNA--[protein]-cysteine S-methyltransferase [Leifsonia poae]|uniref:Methylated-DNA--protein-cysteine methyltransferase n=1 Tax=Leifsonia poae TaxID=110933 RepID=A0A9W6HCI6_9MICO|nr:methylated-DNA--[protein]-cysteine S-methyltransferase [Leifsonia poae]GLJ77397.1 methylated-DNA--protein-cysteine methyltransferase [Leifsonia poae]